MTEADKIDEKIEFARFISNHSFQHISSVDQKASIIVAINGVILGLLFQSESLQEIALEKQEIRVPFQLVVGLLGASAIFGLLTIYPKKKPHPTVIFPKEKSRGWVLDETVAGWKSKKQKKEWKLKKYKEQWKSMDLPKILYAEVTNAQTLIEALYYQFFYLRCSLLLLIAAIVLLSVLLLQAH